MFLPLPAGVRCRFRRAAMPAICLMLAGCAGNGEALNAGNEQLLAAAGFHLYSPKNAEEEANLKAMPQRRVVYMNGAAKPTYLYADHDDCDCIYVGGQAEADRLQQLATRKQAADDSRFQARSGPMLYGWGGPVRRHGHVPHGGSVRHRRHGCDGRLLVSRGVRSRSIRGPGQGQRVLPIEPPQLIVDLGIGRL